MRQVQRFPFKGFTLLELLIAMLILSVMLASVYSAFHVGIAASRRLLGQEKATLDNTMGRLNLMAAEIRNAVYWNNLVVVGSRNELYFYLPMRLKNLSDVFGLYRVRYWFDQSEPHKGTLHRSVAPWIALQKFGLTPEEARALEKTQSWLGPVENFRMDFAVRKNEGSVRVLSDPDEPSEEGEPAEGNGDLIWRESYAANKQTPYGVRLRWGLPLQEEKAGAVSPAQNFSTLFWPALGLYQRRRLDINIAPMPQIMNAADVQIQERR